MKRTGTNPTPQTINLQRSPITGRAFPVLAALWTIAVSSLAAATPTAAAQPTDPKPNTRAIWLDIDTANGVGDIDDGLMLIQALHSPDINLVGVSTVYGNTDLPRASQTARQIIERFGDERTLRVNPGAASPTDNTPTEATRAMAAAVKGGPITILAVGPLTNVATLLREHPDTAQGIEQIVAVAGRRPGQRFLTEGQSPDTEPPDFNFELDPSAMRTVLESGIPVVLAPWEVSSQITITAEDLEKLATRGGASGQWIQKTSQYWLERHAKAGKPGFHPYDSLALAWILTPNLIEHTPMHANIEQSTQGPDQRPRFFLHATPNDAGQKPTGTPITYLHTPKPALKGELLKLLEDDDPAPTTPPHGFAKDQYARLLRSVVEPERGFVSYDELARRADELERVVRSFAQADLKPMSDDQRLALMINAYNAFTLQLILDHQPLDSILDIPEPERWKADRWRFAGRTVSLDELEHQMIRVNWDEPRIHFALVCAAAGCPPLRAEPYTGTALDAQLDDQCRTVHRAAKVVDYDTRTNTATLTPPYAYYAQDFGGPEGVYRFAARYHRPLYFALLRGSPAEISFGGYDWSLNDADR